VGAGETIMVPAGEWHWHGAAPGEDMCHLSIRVPGPTDWTVPNYDW
jgi:quercetin dioxygenase-like cupin family protein